VRRRRVKGGGQLVLGGTAWRAIGARRAEGEAGGHGGYLNAVGRRRRDNRHSLEIGIGGSLDELCKRARIRGWCQRVGDTDDKDKSDRDRRLCNWLRKDRRRRRSHSLSNHTNR
jgi:hypothetical protein